MLLYKHIENKYNCNYLTQNRSKKYGQKSLLLYFMITDLHFLRNYIFQRNYKRLLKIVYILFPKISFHFYPINFLALKFYLSLGVGFDCINKNTLIAFI